MIARLHGILLEKAPPKIVLDVHGVGYEVSVPMSTFYELPATGQSATLFTHLAIREDGHFLYGFSSLAEQIAFEQLIKVSGTGARTALGILSGLSVTELAQCITLQDSARLIKIPGIGKKTAERLLLELKDSFQKRLPQLSGLAQKTNTPALENTHTDVLQALIALGYNEKEALLATRNLPAEANVSDGIRFALKILSKP